MGKKGQHVVPSGGKWSVKKDGATKASSTHRTQGEAIKAATKVAKTQKTEVYIHGQDGRIRERNTFGNDPHPPKG